MKLSLVVMTAGKSKGQAIPVTLPQFIIGRDPQCNLRPASAVISKRHCALITKDGKVSIRDFDSTNGTFVNDTPVKGEVPLKHDDMLKIGPLEFKVAIETKTPTPKPQPAKHIMAPAKQDDDSAAALLLALQEEGAEASTSADDESGVPAGSTVMDIAPVASPETPLPDPSKTVSDPNTEAKPAAKKPDPKNDPAHLAAKAILEKYSRRTRG